MVAHSPQGERTHRWKEHELRPQAELGAAHFHTWSHVRSVCMSPSNMGSWPFVPGCPTMVTRKCSESTWHNARPVVDTPQNRKLHQPDSGPTQVSPSRQMTFTLTLYANHTEPAHCLRLTQRPNVFSVHRTGISVCNGGRLVIQAAGRALRRGAKDSPCSGLSGEEGHPQQPHRLHRPRRTPTWVTCGIPK